MDGRKKGEFVGALGALLVHVAVIALLLLVTFAVPKADEDAGGVPVMLGNVDAAHGFDDPSLVDVDILPEEAATAAPTSPEVPSEQDLLTQEEEETVALKKKTETKKETVKPKEVKKPEKTEAEKAAEAKRLADAKAERDRKVAEEVARNKVAGAFGKGAQMGGNKGSAASGTGVEGSKDGNSSTGEKTGVGGIGASYNLGGRGLGTEGLPSPVYNVQDEGRVVVNITVNPAGQVIKADINLQNTMSTTGPALRKAARDAAMKARFKSMEGVNNQTGTITYNFKFK